MIKNFQYSIIFGDVMYYKLSDSANEVNITGIILLDSLTTRSFFTIALPLIVMRHLKNMNSLSQRESFVTMATD